MWRSGRRDAAGGRKAWNRLRRLRRIHSGPGTWLIGEEISPGLWQNSDSSQGCSWMRLSSLGGGPSAANATGSTSATVLVIQITAADVAFHSSGCGTWTRIGN